MSFLLPFFLCICVLFFQNKKFKKILKNSLMYNGIPAGNSELNCCFENRGVLELFVRCYCDLVLLHNLKIFPQKVF